VAVVLTLVQARQIRINIHKRNNTKNTVQTIQNTVNTSTHITKTPKLLPKHLRVDRCCNFRGVNVIRQEDENILKYRNLTIGIQRMWDVL
jgi:hypothetical protein